MNNNRQEPKKEPVDLSAYRSLLLYHNKGEVIATKEHKPDHCKLCLERFNKKDK